MKNNRIKSDDRVAVVESTCFPGGIAKLGFVVSSFFLYLEQPTNLLVVLVQTDKMLPLLKIQGTTDCNSINQRARLHQMNARMQINKEQRIEKVCRPY